MTDSSMETALPVTVAALVCADCGALDAGPRMLCPSCGADRLSACQVSGAGALLTWTVIRRPPLQFKDEGHYAVALVALDVGLQVTGRLVMQDPEPSGPTRVRAVITHHQSYTLFERTHHE